MIKSASITFAATALLSTTLLAATTEQSPVMSAMMREMTELGDLLQQKHAVLEPVASSNMTAVIIKAIDPYAEILSKEQAERRADEERGGFYGIGASLSVKNNLPIVTETLKAGPAAEAGIKPGSFIEKIDDRKTSGMPLENIVSLLRGAKDTSVKISIRSGDKNEVTNEFTLKRSLIQMPVTGVTEDWPYQIRYMKVNGLYGNSGLQISTQMLSWAEGKCSGIILDLRNADGCDLESAAETAGLFAPAEAPLFNVRDGSGALINSYKNKSAKNVKMLVMALINRNTSGAAETLAAALGADKDILLIGEPTRGDACLREAVPLPDGRIIYLATRKIEMLRGMPYQGAGVIPQVAVAQTDEAVKAEESSWNDENGIPQKLSEQEKDDRALMRRTRNDAVLQRAVDILLGLKALSIKGL